MMEAKKTKYTIEAENFDDICDEDIFDADSSDEDVYDEVDEIMEFEEKLHNKEKRESKERPRTNRYPMNSTAIAVRRWLRKTTFTQFSKAIEARVVGQSELDIVLANIWNYFNRVAYGKKIDNNMLIAAPSGCGKTETFRAIRDYFRKELPQIPIAQQDMTSITEEGYKGKNTADFLKPLLDKSASNGVGIIFADEFDKKLVPSYSGKGNNVNAAIQAQLLTVIEGTVFTGPGEATIDTSNTMFIAMGAFDMCRNTRNDDVKHLGFNAEFEKEIDHYDSITKEDMIKVGASHELLGRFLYVVNYKKLNKECINKIIDGMLVEHSNSLGCDLVLTPKARKQLINSANSQYGCRLIKSHIQQATMPAYIKMIRQEKAGNGCRIKIKDINPNIKNNAVVEENDR